MARKPVERSLPALRSLHPHFDGFTPAQTISAALARLLRDSIARIRIDHATPFYSVRQVAEFFGVSTRTAANVYAQLESEGLLTRVRSSQTILPGRKLQPRHRIRGVVGIAIPIPTFICGTGLRSFYIRFEEELRQRRFLADFIFYQPEEERLRPADLASRLLLHHLDLLFWFAPGRSVVPVISQLQDAGILPVIVGDGKASYPREQYFVELGRGVAEGLAAWTTAGIDRVVVCVPAGDAGGYGVESITRQCARCHLPWEQLALPAAAAARRLGQLARQPRVGVVLLPYHWCSLLCEQFPQTMERLFRSSRVMLAQGAINYGFFRDKPVFADCVGWPYEQMARRIARDISARTIATATRLTTFSTHCELRVDLGKVTLED